MSHFVVSARKYRPIRFDRVVGQEHVSQTLKNAIKSNHLAQAFLFCGPRGVGKTTCARLLAKLLNCQAPTPDIEPCDQCNSCLTSKQNASLNIHELDAASNNSVEHIRSLIEQVRFPPQKGQYKIYIIDEVHMLSQAAFNAFLKTLEEPPQYAIFILATTEKHKIIPTILSRCQIFDFNRIQVKDMLEHLKKICVEESVQAQEEALHLIAQKADGALRDALSIFDRMVSFSGDQILYEDVIKNLNILDYDYYFKIVDAIAMEQSSVLLLLFDQIMRKGFEGDIFINGLALHFRNLLVAQDPRTIPLLELSGQTKQRYLEQAKIIPKGLILSALSLANICDIHYKMARNKRLHVEMTLIKMAFIQKATQASTSLASASPIMHTEKKNEGNKQAPTINKRSVSAPVETNLISNKLEKKEEKKQLPPLSKEPNNLSSPSGSSFLDKLKSNADTSLKNLAEDIKKEEASPSKAALPLNLDNLQQLWEQYASQHPSPSTTATLRAVKLLLQEKEQIILVSLNNNMAKELLQRELELMRFIKATFQTPELQLKFKIEVSESPITQKVVKKPETDREKYLHFLNQNKSLVLFQKRFQLFPPEKK